MPVIQKIEITNFLNIDRGTATSWSPRWPHQVFDLGGLNSAMNIPNGKGKTAMVTTILAMLVGERRTLKEIRDFSFAPQRHGHFTHIRIQVLVSTPSSGGADLLSLAGGEPGGDPMVFGVYGNSGENGELHFYSYQGTLEDCPVAHANGYAHTFVDNVTFRSQLDAAPKLFPANRQEGTDRAWQDHVQTIFDMASIQQQLKYQKLRGGEGGHGYFDVPNPPGSEYSASVFYERLAPELLVEGMGELGDEDEHGIEDTIHTKVHQLIVHKHKGEQQEKMLVKAQNTLEELKNLDVSRDGLNEAKQKYDAFRQSLSQEFAALKFVIVDEPIPGIPRIPDESFPLARTMVLQNGKWYLTDRVMAEFTDEPASEVNRRAEERNRLALQKMDRSQVIDFACHIKTRDARGKANQLYDRKTALAVLALTSNFTRDWTKQKAIETVTLAFDWVETHADTNPARELLSGFVQTLSFKEAERKRLNDTFEEHGKEWSKLVTEQSRISEVQSAHREMLGSGLFTDDEIAAPEATRDAVATAYLTAMQGVESHKDRIRRLEEVHAAWRSFQHEHPDTMPADLVEKISGGLAAAKEALSQAKSALQAARDARGKAKARLQAANNGLNTASGSLERFLETAPAAAHFKEVFGDVSPVGLARQVQEAVSAARKRKSTLEIEQSRMSDPLDALRKFRKQFGDVDLAVWLSDRNAAWEALGRDIGTVEGELKEAQIQRAGLNAEAIVSGKVTREAAEIAGGNHVPLYAVINEMKIDQVRRESVLTLFSALLHTPVYVDIQEARQAAARLEEKRVEVPVFLRGELETFCRSEDVSPNAALTHNWLVGIRTRQVDCLLDTSLVEREKAALDTEIRRCSDSIETLKKERDQISLHSPDGMRATKAVEAVRDGFEEMDAKIVVELAELKASLPELEHRADSEMIGVIQAAEKHHQAFSGVSEAELRRILDAATTEQSLADNEASTLEAKIEACEKDADVKQNESDIANTAALQLGNLKKLQTYIDAPDDNPAFMAQAQARLVQLESTKSTADARTRFRFDDVAAFHKQGSDYAKNVETRIADLKSERANIQDKLLPALTKAIDKLNESKLAASLQEGKIDRLVHEMTRMYRGFDEFSDDLLPISLEEILTTTLGAQTIGIREAVTASERVELLVQMADEMDFEAETQSRRDMNAAKSAYDQQKTKFDGAINLALAKPDMEMSDHMRSELERARSTPNIVEELLRVQALNYDKSAAANRIAQDHLEAEWTKLSEWLANFTKRLKNNFSLLQKVFGPNIDKDTKTILNPGYQIIGNVSDDASIKDVLNGVVSTIEKSEAESSGKSLTQYEEKKRKIELRQTIRNQFYRSVIQDVRIKVCMSSISKNPLALERKMVSTGQGIAMGLLWIVKMAEFTTKRWQNEQASSLAQRKRLRHTQFTIIDGAFSSLSDEGLIRDAMDSIDATKGAFQLIITDHDPEYRNDFNYFPTLIVAKEFDGRFMIADKLTGEPVSASLHGVRQGAVGVMALRAVPVPAAGT